MADDDDSVADKLAKHGTLIGILVAASGAFPSLAKWGEVVTLEAFQRTADGDWAGSFVEITPGAILLASGVFNAGVLGLTVLSSIPGRHKGKLLPLAFMALVLGSVSSNIFYTRNDAAERQLVAAARAAEASAAATASAPPRAGVVRDAAIAATGRTATDDSLIGFPYAIWFAMWTLFFALLSQKYYFLERKKPRRQSARPATEPAPPSGAPGL